MFKGSVLFADFEATSKRHREAQAGIRAYSPSHLK